MSSHARGTAYQRQTTRGQCLSRRREREPASGCFPQQRRLGGCHFTLLDPPVKQQNQAAGQVQTDSMRNIELQMWATVTCSWTVA